jgi:hypothetical protein
MPALTHPAISVPSSTGTNEAQTVTQAAHAAYTLDAGATHPAIGTHVGTDYGVHTFTAPPAHGTAGTVTHSFTQPSDHTISAHDTVSQLPSYYALCFIIRHT